MQPFSNESSSQEKTDTTLSATEDSLHHSMTSTEFESPRVSATSEVSSVTINTTREVTENHERIAERIVNGYELRLMTHLPTYNERLQHTTIITAEGIFQWNADIEQWAYRISVENFNTAYQALSFLLERASEVTDQEGILIYNALTLQQLNALDQALRLHQGHTIIGYSICEEIYLREINFLVWLVCGRFSKYDYPPLPESYSKRLLTFIQRPIVLDIASSLRIAAQSFILFYFFVKSYVQYTTENQYGYTQFMNNNNNWIFLSFYSVIVMNLFLLYSGCLDKKRILLVMIRLRWIEQSIIGMVSNLLNYGPFLASTSVITGSILPLIILGGLIGYYKRIGEIINIAQWTSFQFLLRGFFSSLTGASFCAAGFNGFLIDVFFLYAPDDTQEEYVQDGRIVRYSAFAMIMLLSLFRNPIASLITQHWGRYANNWMNGISIALLDNYALTLLIQFPIFTIMGNTVFSPQEPIAPTFFCMFTALSFISVFLVTFPTTPNLPEYSLEKNPIKPTWITKTFRFFNDITHCRIPSDVSRITSMAHTGVEFVSERMASFARAVNMGQLYPHASKDTSKSMVENPIHHNGNTV